MAFVTAYDQYAIEAFERAVVDYVLKPANALEKVSPGGTAPSVLSAPLKWLTPQC